MKPQVKQPPAKVSVKAAYARNIEESKKTLTKVIFLKVGLAREKKNNHKNQLKNLNNFTFFEIFYCISPSNQKPEIKSEKSWWVLPTML